MSAAILAKFKSGTRHIDAGGIKNLLASGKLKATSRVFSIDGGKEWLSYDELREVIPHTFDDEAIDLDPMDISSEERQNQGAPILEPPPIVNRVPNNKRLEPQVDAAPVDGGSIPEWLKGTLSLIAIIFVVFSIWRCSQMGSNEISGESATLISESQLSAMHLNGKSKSECIKAIGRKPDFADKNKDRSFGQMTPDIFETLTWYDCIESGAKIANGLKIEFVNDRALLITILQH